MVKDPVCGMEVEEGKICSEFEGKTYCFCCQGCKEDFDLNPKKYLRKMVKDPVCGMEVEEGKYWAEYEGKIYSFCCQGCKEDFELNPKRYLKKT